MGAAQVKFKLGFPGNRMLGAWGGIVPTPNAQENSPAVKKLGILFHREGSTIQCKRFPLYPVAGVLSILSQSVLGEITAAALTFGKEECT